jgi:hypothetical protein
MKLFFAGATHAGQSRVREQIRVTLKTPLMRNTNSKLNNNLILIIPKKNGFLTIGAQ